MESLDVGTMVMVFLQLAMSALWVAVWSRFGRIETKVDGIETKVNGAHKRIGETNTEVGIVKERLRGHMESGGHE